MKTVAISLLLPLLLAQTKAAPASANLEARQDSTPDIVFEGAAGANFTLSGVPRDNTIFYITNPLSVSFIRVNIENIAGHCVFNGTEGSETIGAVFEGDLNESGDPEIGFVGPPQPQLSGACLGFQFPTKLCTPPSPPDWCSPHPPPKA